jgi:hypothetical protein
MKIYIVMSKDTNCVISVDKVFQHKHVAEEYISIQSKKYRALDYFINERLILEGIS